MEGKPVVRTAPRSACFICGTEGKDLFHGLKDQLFSAPGEWSLSRCPACSLLWLNPYPVTEDFGLLYSTYYTHQTIKKTVLSLFFDRLTNGVYKSMGYKVAEEGSLGVAPYIPFLNEYMKLSILGVKPTWGKKLLDVGAGNGEYLNVMRRLGWDVEGTETDPKAAEFARNQYQLKIHTGILSELSLPSESFDVITLNHVIEHVPDSESLLRECRRVLKKGGRLVLLTPNSEGLGFRKFGKHWRGLEIPRHIAVFSVSNLGVLAKRLQYDVDTLTSTARISRYLYSTSMHMKQGKMQIGGGGNRGYWLALKSYVFQAWEECCRLFNKKVGEEIYFVGIKR